VFACDHVGFAEAVGEHIAPLVASQQFACIEATPYVVKFESPKVVLIVSHDRMSYEIEASFVRKSDRLRRSFAHWSSIVCD